MINQSHDHASLIHRAQELLVDEAEQQKIIHCLDYTRLECDDVPENIIALCDTAKKNNVAAVCVYPKYVSLAKKELANSGIRLASVINFPAGNDNVSNIQNELKAAMSAGADEIDFVFPYNLFLQGEETAALEIMRACRNACDGLLLKVIVESGAIADPKQLKKMCEAIIDDGADFLKTSTGKIKQGASLEAAAIMLQTILTSRDKGFDVGFKASGGIRSMKAAGHYFRLAQLILGEEWPTKAHFRIGCSRILE